MPRRPQRSAVQVDIAFVAANERKRSLAEAHRFRVQASVGCETRAHAVYHRQVHAWRQGLEQRDGLGDGMIGAALNTRVGPLCRTVKDTARVLEVIAGYDPKDELTAFSVGRLPSEPYRSFANERSLNGIRIGVIREHMNKKLFNDADVESIDIADRAIDDLRRLGATIIDPGPDGALFQTCVDKYAPLYRNRAFIEQFPSVFTADSSGKPASDNVARLVDMFFDPSLVPAGPTIRSLGPAPNSGQAKYMLNRYLKKRGDPNIKTIADLINKSNFYQDIRPDAGFVDRKAALEEMNSSGTLDMANIFQDRFAYQEVVLQCMAQQNLDALVSPARNIPAYILGAPFEPPLAGRTNSVWGLLGQHGFPTLSVPAGWMAVALTAAVGSYRQALAIHDKLAQERGDDTNQQFEVVQVYNGLGPLYEKLHKPAEALEVYGKAIPVLEQLVKKHEREAKYRQLLAGMYHNRGVVYEDVLGRHDEALKSFQQALDLEEQLLKETPHDLFVQHYLASGRRAGVLDLAVRPWWRFLRAYVFKLGFLDGWPGYYIAWLSAFSAVTRYAKVRETQLSPGAPT